MTGFEPAFVQLQGDTFSPVITARVEGAEALFSLPLHPHQGPAGGVVVFRLGTLTADGLAWCNQQHEVTVQSLPGARVDQGVRAELTLLRDLLDTLLHPFGLSGRELAATDPQTLDGAPLMLWAPAYLAHGEEGVEPIYNELSPSEQQLADDLVAGWQQVREQQPVAFNPPQGATLDPPSGAGTPPGLPESGSTDERTGGVSSVDTHSDTTTLGSPESCNRVDNQQMGRLLGQQVSGDTMLSGNAGHALKAGAEISGLPIISRTPGASAVGYLAWAVNFAAEYAQGTLPSKLDEIWLDVSPVKMLEDDPGHGQVEQVGLRFRSEGWDMGPALADLAISLAGGLASKRFQNALEATPSGALDARQVANLVDGLQPLEVAHPELITELTSWLASKATGLVVEQHNIANGWQVIPSECWEAPQSPNDSDPDALRLHYTQSIREGDAWDQFVAISTGTGMVDARWELPVGDGLVGVFSADVRQARYAFGARQPVEIQPLNVTITPQRQSVDPGEQVELMVRAGPALDGRVRLRDSIGGLDEEVDALDGHTFTYQVPADQARGSRIRIEAKSLSSTGLRNPARAVWRGPVQARANLRLEQPRLYLQPADACLEPGESRRYQAVDDPLTGQPVAVRWQATGAEVGADGRVRAPGAEGQIRLTAVAQVDPELTASWTLSVGECGVNWHASLSGSNAPVNHTHGNRAVLSEQKVASQVRSGRGWAPVEGPFLNIDLQLPDGATNTVVPDNMEDPEAILRFLIKVDRGEVAIPPGVIITVPEFAVGKTGDMRDVVIRLPNLNSIADLGRGPTDDGWYLNEQYTTAKLTISANSDTRLAGKFSARLLDHRFSWNRRQHEIVERESGIWFAPEEEVLIQGAFDIDLTTLNRLPWMYQQ